MTQEKKKPRFVRHAAHRKKKLAEVWRKPKGLQNKLRLNKKSRGVRVSSGYRSPTSTRGLVSGKKQALVYTKEDLFQYEPDVHAITVGKTGNKRRLELLEEAKKQGFIVLNHDVEKKTTEIKESVKERSSTRKEREEKRKAQEKAAQEAAKKESKAQEKVKETSAEDEKKAEKKEQEKILTKKEQ